MAMTFSTTGAASVAGFYFVGVGIDEVIAGLREYSGQAGVRSGHENALDAVTGNQNVTDTIWFITDAGADLTAGYKVAIREFGEQAAERTGKNTAEITVERTKKNGDNAVAPKTLGDVNLKGTLKGYGMNLADEGRFFGWKPSSVSKRAGDFTKQMLLDRGWTKQRLLEVAEKYEWIDKLTPRGGNPSAAGRAAQLREILEALF